MPIVRSLLPEMESPPPLEPEQARFRLFDWITTFLSNASDSRPLLLVQDNPHWADLHWADQPSLLPPQVLTRELTGSRIPLVG